MKNSIIICFLILSLNIVKAQSSLNKELSFVEHLINKEMYNEAILEISSLNLTNFSKFTQDSLHYFLGYSHYGIQQLEKSTHNFLKVSEQSPLFPKSLFFASYNQAHTGQSNKAIALLNKENRATKDHLQMKLFQLSGFALLKRDLNLYQTFNSQITNENYTFVTERKKLNTYSQIILNYKQKKPWLAGVLSSIIPGAGKIYAGKTGEGIASFLMITSMGLITYENYHKTGPKNIKTLFFGSVFTIFHIGNIYGSVFSAKLKNEEFNHEMDQRILFNLHIPLRNYFD